MLVAVYYQVLRGTTIDTTNYPLDASWLLLIEAMNKSWYLDVPRDRFSGYIHQGYKGYNPSYKAIV